MTDPTTATTDPKAPQPTESAAGAGFSAVAGSTVLLHCDLSAWRRVLVLLSIPVLTLLALAYNTENQGDLFVAGISVGLWIGCAHNVTWAIAQRSRDRSNTKFRDAGGQSPALRTDDQPHSL